MRFEAREVQRRTPISPKGEPLQIPQLRKITAAPAILQIGSEIQAQGLISTRIIPGLPHCISMLLLNSAAAARLKHVPPKGEQDGYPNQGTVKAGVSDEFCK